MTRDLDDLARTTHQLVTETASRQVSREIVHLAEIEVDGHGVHAVAPPTGYRAPTTGVITTHVLARSRDVPGAAVETRVAVWVSDSDATVLITRADAGAQVELAADDLHPEPTAPARGQVNDFVAVIIAHMISSLNVAMQRSYTHESGGDVAEYERG